MFQTSTRCNNCTTCNNNIYLFEKLTKTELEIINKDRFEVVFKPGETILKQGAVSKHIISITNGFAKVYLEGVHGKNQILKIVKPWQLIGGPGLHTDSRLYFSVQALTETNACFINFESFNQIIETNKEFARNFLTYLNKIQISLYELIISLTQKQMPGRIADGLLYLSQEVFGNTINSHLISRQDLADLTSMSKDSAIRILKDLEKDGYIDCTGDKIEIIDIGALKNVSKNG